MLKRLFVVGCCWLVGSVFAQEPVFINEFMANNATTLRDKDLEYSDWIEFRNTSAAAVDLNGYYLTDSAANLKKWKFPSVSVPANGYLVIFASGKDLSGAEVHTSFSLDANGEYLAFVKPDGVTKISEFSPKFPQQYKDYSYGLDETGTNWVYFSKGSPRAANTNGVIAFAKDTKFSQTRGFYSAPFDLAISTETTGATIRYTTNGTVPSLTNGITYTNGIGIRISGTTVIRASAFKAGYQPSPPDTQTYLFLNDVIHQAADGRAPAGWPTTWGGNVVDYGMDTNVVNDPAYRDTIVNDLKTIPSFSIVMNLDDLFGVNGIYVHPDQDGRAWERVCSVEYIRPDGVDGFHVNAGIRIRGGFSRSLQNPKHAFRLFFREEYGDNKLKYPLFGDSGTDEFNAIDLRTFQNYSWSFQGDSQGTFFRDVYTRDTQLAMGQQGERGDYCHLYINGMYWGVYNTDERAEASYGETYFGGKSEDYDVIKVEAGPYTINATDGNMTAWTTLYNAAKAGLSTDAAFFKLQGMNPDGTVNPAYTNLVDVPNLIDYMLVIIYTGNKDAPISNFLDINGDGVNNDAPNNWYGLRNRDGLHGGFRFIAHDSEHTLLVGDLNIDRTGPFVAGQNGLSYSNPQYIWQQMSANAEFRLQVADHIQKHFFNGGLLTPESTTARVRARMADLDRAVVGESARWGDAKHEPAYTRATWLAACNSVLNTWIPQRSAIALNQLRAKSLYPNIVAPTLSQHGGNVPANYQLTLSAPAGIIYYTLDGSDSRLIGGAVSPAARPYASAITLPNSTKVKARVLSGSTWSALEEADFYTIQNYQGLLITEIMYHPVTTNGVDTSDLEFIELKNTTASEMDLSGVRFTNGIAYTFPLGKRLAAGKFAVLVRNFDAFTNQYPGVAVDGVYTNKLADSGERIDLVHASGTSIFSVSYLDSVPWPQGADGAGFSLVPINPNANANPNDPANWRASSRFGGSPGIDDPPLDVFPIIITEALTHTDVPAVDAIELFNPTTEVVDIGGWYLTDDRLTPRKFRIPSPKWIDSGAYVVFTEADFNTPPEAPTSFSLSSSGDEVFLYSADLAGNLTGYSDGFSFGGAANGVTFGRYTNSVGEILFPAQLQNTLGATNSGPRIGDVVINEIRYHPRPGEEEFIELRNRTGSAIKLYDANYPTNGWRLSGVDFMFPQGAEIPANGYIVVAGVDPVLFRAHNPVPESTVIYGPFNGALQDNGELIELQRPDAPEQNASGAFSVPYITVDDVRYNDHAPWPLAAAGSGPSLERISADAFGNDPSNWRASPGPASPGFNNNGNRPPIVSAGPDASFEATTFPLTVNLTPTVSDDGLPSGTLSYAWTQRSGPGVVQFGNANAAATTALLPGVGTYVLRLTVSDGDLSGWSEINFSVGRPAVAATFVASGSRWKYLDDNSNQGTAWRATNFVDTAWKEGPARLGYGGDGEVTTVDGGPTSARYVTTYFRRSFNVTNVSGLRDLTVRLLRDDGGVVYLNGQEIFRSNLPEGATITSSTPASGTVSDTDEHAFFDKAVAPTLLHPGTNLLAVEIHQVSGTSSDIGFDLILEGNISPDNSAPIVNAGPDLAVTLPQSAELLGSVIDDGLPNPPGAPATQWTVLNGPAPVMFANTAAPHTTAQFSTPGTYVLQLSANDGAFTITDQITVQVAGGNAYASWKATYFTASELNDPSVSGDNADPDGDHFGNLAEFLAGTDPRNGLSYLGLGAAHISTGIGLTFQVIPGRSYEILSRDSVDSGVWSLVRSVAPSANAQIIEVDDDIDVAEPTLFYRLSIPQQ